MARIIGGITTSHVPAIGGAIHRKLQDDPYWKPFFDGSEARRGYALNKMCYSFNSAENRAQFMRDEEAYCRKFGLDEAQRAAVRHRNVLELIAAGGNIYYLAKFAGILGLDVQDIGAQQTGMTKDEFKAMLARAGT